MEPKIIKKDIQEDKLFNNQKKVLVLSILCMIVLLLSSSYAIMTNFSQKEDAITFSTGNLEISILNGEETFSLINLNNKLPESDQSGLARSTVIPITLKNTGTMIIGTYEIKLITETGTENITTLSEDYIRFSISEDNITYSTPSTLTTNDNIIYTSKDLEIDAEKVIYLKVWINENAFDNGIDKTYYGTLEINLEQQYTPLAPIIINVSDAGFGKITFTVEDKLVGENEYCINQSQEDTTSCTWYEAIVGEQTTETYVSETGIYYVHVKDEEGNIGHSTGIQMTITYNLLEYLENTGTQYIDTNYIPNANTSVDVIYKGVNYSGSQYIMGARKSSSSTLLYAISGSSSKTIWNITFGGTSTFSTIERTADKFQTKVSMTNGTGTWVLKNLGTNTSETISFSNMTVSATVNMFIFSFNSSNIHKNLRIYSCKIYDNGILVRDYLPVERISDGILGLYDQVENKIYLNAGTGTFTKGTNVGVL